MATKIEKLKFFNLTLGLKTSLDVSAGHDQAEAAQGRYKTKNGAGKAIFVQLLTKLSNAIDAETSTIDVNIQDDKFIIKDPP